MPALGERFRAAREARGLTLSEVAEQIRIRSVYLGAIEEENWSVIGAPVYIRGFLRTYARFLALDSEQAVAAFNELTAGAIVPVSTDPPQVPRRSPKGLQALIWVASAIAVALIAFVVYNEVTLQSRPLAAASPTPSPTASGVPSISPPNSASPSASSAPARSGPHTLSISLGAASWLRVAVDGNVTIEGTFPAGTQRTFRGNHALIRIGNAGGVRVLVDGKSIGPLGKSGDVVERAFTL
ncbi:MAG TPA: RodZ domain-containing protein [Candidatus Baltobacteraceae bacterium]